MSFWIFWKKKAKSEGWIIQVDINGNILLFIVVVSSPVDAENILRAKLNLAPETDVKILNPAPAEQISKFKLKTGEIKGPM